MGLLRVSTSSRLLIDEAMVTEARVKITKRGFPTNMLRGEIDPALGVWEVGRCDKGELIFQAVVLYMRHLYPQSSLHNTRTMGISYCYGQNTSVEARCQSYSKLGRRM